MVAKFSAGAIRWEFLQASRKELLLMPDLDFVLTPPNVFLTVGIIFISGAAVFAYTGKVWVRFSGWVYREKQPRVFWGEVAAYFLGGAFLSDTSCLRFGNFRNEPSQKK